MPRMVRSRFEWLERILVGLAAAAVALPAGRADAQSPRSFERGRDPGPVTESARVVRTNPSAMALVEGVSLDLDHTLQLRSQSFESERDEADAFDLQSDPRLAFVSNLGTDRFRVGFAGGVPRRYGAAWPSDGPQRYESIFHRVRGIYLTGAVSFSPLDWLHLGGSASFVQAEYRSYRAIDMGRIVARQENVDPGTVPRRNPGNEGREFLDFSGRSFGWSAGITATPGNLRIGAAYEGPVPLEMSGNYELYLPRNDYYEERYGGDVNREATLETRWPGRLDVGAAYALDSGTELFVHLGWSRWSSVDAIEVDVDEEDSPYSFDRRRSLDLNDRFIVRAGGSFRPIDRLVLDASIGYQSAAVPAEELTARVLDTPKILAALGAGWSITETVRLRAGYQHVQYLGATAEASVGGGSETYGQTLGLVETSISVRLP